MPSFFILCLFLCCWKSQHSYKKRKLVIHVVFKECYCHSSIYTKNIGKIFTWERSNKNLKNKNLLVPKLKKAFIRNFKQCLPDKYDFYC